MTKSAKLAGERILRAELPETDWELVCLLLEKDGGRNAVTLASEIRVQILEEKGDA